MKKNVASEAEIKKLYDPNTFYDHGSNPALKRFMEIMTENVKQGRIPNYRIHFMENYTRIHKARNWEDFLQLDLKCYTLPRSLLAFTLATWLFALSSRHARRYIPIGSHGIKSLQQTQFYQLYGPVGCLFVTLLPLTGGYIWYKTAKFTAKKIYYHGLLGERNWIAEGERNNPSVGEYYFSDSPWSSEEDFPDLARGEMAKKKF